MLTIIVFGAATSQNVIRLAYILGGFLDTPKNLQGTPAPQTLATSPLFCSWHRNLLKLAVKTPHRNALVPLRNLQLMHRATLAR